MSLDEQLIMKKQESGGSGAANAWAAQDSARKEAWEDKAGRLREAQRTMSGGGQGNASTSLREAVQAEKAKGADNKTGAEKGEEAPAAPTAISLGSAKLLQQSWLNIIPSFGCTLLWINIHAFFLNQIFGEKYFCKLGKEWTGAIPGAGAAGAATGAAAGAKDSTRGSFELWGLIGCDLGCLFIIIAIASLVYMVAAMINNPLTAFEVIGTTLWNLLKNIF